MIRTIFAAAFIFCQAAVLLAAGVAVIWWAQDLMRWLIFMVGEEYALGSRNVIQLEGGGKLLTNPAAMVRWMLPFWFLGAVQISAAITLIWLWANRFRSAAKDSSAQGGEGSSVALSRL